jgi:hypothetical protein
MIKIYRFKYITVIIFIYCLGFWAKGQSMYYPLNDELSIRLEKSLYRQDLFHSNIKPYNNLFSSISDSTNNLLTLNTLNNFSNHLFNLNSIIKSGQNGTFIIDPIISIMPDYEIDEAKIYHNYQFGLSFSGSLGQKFDFRINGLYGIKSFPEEQEFMIDSTGKLPHLGNYLSKKGNNYNFATLTGYLSYSPYKFLNINLGIGKHFWGDGYRSLFLSDNSAAFPYLQTTVEIWRLKYLWLIGALSDKNPDYNDNKYRTKLLIAHFLSYNTTNWLNFSFFEAVVANPTDSAGLTYLNPGYLNPVIFLRPVEFASGSTDNVIMGFGFKLKLYKKYHFYGQLLLDEFVLSEIRSGNGWWGNKYGFQLGLKIFDLFGIENLFSRIEYNQVRPYTYSYYNSFGNYGNSFQPLAHPLGANFKELTLEEHYHFKRFSVHVLLISAEAGTDLDSASYGQNIYKSNVLKISEYGIKQGQGQKGRYLDIGFRFSWMINPKNGLSIFAQGQVQKYTNFQYKPDGKFISFGICSHFLNEKPNRF